MPENLQLTIGGRTFPVLQDKNGKRAIASQQRPSQPSDPGVPKVARWLLSGPQGNSREDVSEGAGILSVDYTEGIDTLYDALALPGPKVNDIDIVSGSQSEFVETANYYSVDADGDSATGDTGAGTVDWTDPENVLVDNSSAATAVGDGTTKPLRVLLAAAERVPEGATVTGVRLMFRRRATPGAAWKVIDSVTLGSAASSVSFTGIDTTYRMFRLTAYVVKDGTSSGGTPGLVLNNDTGANYERQTIRGSTTVITAARTTGQTSIGLAGSTTLGGDGATFIVATIAKQSAAAAAMVVASNAIAVSSLFASANAGRWNNTTDLISRIDLISSSGNFAAGTVVVLEAC